MIYDIRKICSVLAFFLHLRSFQPGPHRRAILSRLRWTSNVRNEEDQVPLSMPCGILISLTSSRTDRSVPHGSNDISMVTGSPAGALLNLYLKQYTLRRIVPPASLRGSEVRTLTHDPPEPLPLVSIYRRMLIRAATAVEKKTRTLPPLSSDAKRCQILIVNKSRSYVTSGLEFPYFS